MRTRWAVAILLSMLLGATAIADEQLIGLGAGYWNLRFSATTTPACVKRGSGSSSCAIFPAGLNRDHLKKGVTVVSDGPGCCCFSMGLSAASGATPAGGDVTLNTSTCELRLTAAAGPGDCMTFPVLGGTWQTRPERLAMIDTMPLALRKIGLCHTPTSTTGDTLNMPCSSNAECASGSCYGIANATAIDSEDDSAGVILTCASTAGTVPMAVRKDRVRK